MLLVVAHLELVDYNYHMSYTLHTWAETLSQRENCMIMGMTLSGGGPRRSSKIHLGQLSLPFTEVQLVVVCGKFRYVHLLMHHTLSPQTLTFGINVWDTLTPLQLYGPFELKAFQLFLWGIFLNVMDVIWGKLPDLLLLALSLVLHVSLPAYIVILWGLSLLRH